MRRSVLPLCIVVVLGAALLACMPAAPPPPQSAAPPPLLPTACNAATFVNKISYLTTPFQPQPGPVPPTGPLPSGPGIPDYAADLANAFNAASPTFRQQLCTLDAVYINAVRCNTSADCFNNSWGWRQSQPQPTTPNGRVIALSTDLWELANYSQYETALTQSILPTSQVTYAGALTCSASGSCQSIDNLPMALMAALAHEMGHIGWYVVVDPLAKPTDFCSGKFFDKSWASVNRPPHWRTLLTLNERDRLRGVGKWLDHHKNPPRLKIIDHPGVGGPPAKQSIYRLLAPGQPWASLFAAISPDEDFVETYKFKVLTTAVAPLSAVTITVPGFGTSDIAADYVAGAKPQLTTRVGCVPILF